MFLYLTHYTFKAKHVFSAGSNLTTAVEASYYYVATVQIRNEKNVVLFSLGWVNSDSFPSTVLLRVGTFQKSVQSGKLYSNRIHLNLIGQTPSTKNAILNTNDCNKL